MEKIARYKHHIVFTNRFHSNIADLKIVKILRNFRKESIFKIVKKHNSDMKTIHNDVIYDKNYLQVFTLINQ